MTKALVGIGAVIILALGGYLVFNSMNSADPQNSEVQGAATSTDQVQAQEVSVGTGTLAVPGATVSVLYIGQFPDGTVFDSSEMHGNQPLTFVLGSDGMIPGFQIGVNGMKEGGERLIAIPPALGYGDQEIKDPATGKVVIPANSTLVFDVKLVKVVPPSATSTQQ